jgi:hypothetical protein
MDINTNALEVNQLKALRIEPTFATPTIVMDAESGVFKITGNSYPEDPWQFYMPVIDWFQKYSQHPLPRTVFEFRFTYFSTACTQLIFELFRILETMFKNKYEVLVRWFYSTDNDEIHENGIDFSDLFDLPFEVEEVPDDNPPENRF